MLTKMYISALTTISIEKLTILIRRNFDTVLYMAVLR